MVLQFPWFSSYDLLLQFFLLFPFSVVRCAFIIQHSLLQHTQAFQARSNHCEDVFWAQNTFILISSDWFRQFKITWMNFLNWFSLICDLEFFHEFLPPSLTFDCSVSHLTNLHNKKINRFPGRLSWDVWESRWDYARSSR